MRGTHFYNGAGSEITENEIPPIATGAITIECDIERNYTVIYFTDHDGCFSTDPQEDYEVFSELIRSIYQ